MTTTTRISPDDLRDRLPDVLDRVGSGERFSIERDHRVVAVLEPPPAKPGITLGELAAILAKLPPVDEDFAADLAAIRAEQSRTEPPPRRPPWDNRGGFDR